MEPVPVTIGPYRVVRQLGEGGMGVVYEAIHDNIERRVAIKVLHSYYAHQKDIAARFINEARAVNRIGHPGLVQVSDFGYLPTGAGFIVMEFLQGESLAHRLKRHGGRLAPADAVYLSIQIADSLAAAHDKGVIHRDLKPDNVMIVADPQMPTGERTKILDFGIAKVPEEANQAAIKTKTNAMIGTPTYMSPEQCAGAGLVNDKTDVYALGVMLFEMTAGKPPFMADGVGLLINMHLSMPAPRLRDVAPLAPAPLSDLVFRLLKKDKDERPSMREVHRQLEAIAKKLPPPRRPADKAEQPVPADQAVIVPLEQRSTLGLAASQARSQPGWRKAGALGAGGLMLMGGSAFVFFTVTQPRQAEVPRDPKPTPTLESSKAAEKLLPSLGNAPTPNLGLSVTSSSASPLTGIRTEEDAIPTPKSRRPTAGKKAPEPVKLTKLPGQTVARETPHVESTPRRQDKPAAAPQVRHPAKPATPPAKSDKNGFPIID